VTRSYIEDYYIGSQACNQYLREFSSRMMPTDRVDISPAFTLKRKQDTEDDGDDEVDLNDLDDFSSLSLPSIPTTDMRKCNNKFLRLTTMASFPIIIVFDFVFLIFHWVLNSTYFILQFVCLPFLLHDFDNLNSLAIE